MRPLVLVLLAFVSACAPGEAQLERFERRGDGGEGVTELDGGVEMVTATSIVVRPVGAARFDLDEVDDTSEQPTIQVLGEWTEQVETEDYSAVVRIELAAEATPLSSLEGEDAASYQLDGRFSIDTASIECTSHRARTSCGATGVVDASVTGLLSIVEDDATLRLGWHSFGMEPEPARPEITFAAWPTTGRSTALMVHHSDVMATAIEQAGLVGGIVQMPSWPADVRELESPTGSGRVWIVTPDR